MSDGENAGGERDLGDAFSLDDPSADPARAEAARREAARIEQERQEAARRLAAARAQIAEFDQSRHRGSKWGRGAKRAREASDLLGEITRDSPGTPTPTGGYQEPDYDRPDNRDAAREVLRAFAETQAEAEAAQDATDAPERRGGRHSGPQETSPTRSLRSITGRRGKDAGSDRASTGPATRASGDSDTPPPGRRAQARLRLASSSRTEPAPSAPSTPSPPSTPSTAGGRAARPRASTPPRTGFSTNVDFKPRTLTRSLLTVLLLVVLAATVVVGLTLQENRNTLNVGLTATLAVLTLFLYSIRASAAVAHLRVRGGLLEIKRGGRRDVFDLSSRFTPIEVTGRPSRKNWKVVMLRTDGMPQVIDSSMVDPQHFMQVLALYRPDLAPEGSTQ